MKVGDYVGFVPSNNSHHSERMIGKIIKISPPGRGLAWIDIGEIIIEMDVEEILVLADEEVKIFEGYLELSAKISRKHFREGEFTNE